MKTISRLFLFFFFNFFLFSCHEKTVNIFVDHSGDDRNPGTKELPVKTITQAKILTQNYSGKAKVDVIINDGTYYLSETVIFTHEDSGTEEFPVSYIAKNRGKVIISGGQRLNLNWYKWTKEIYQAKIADDVCVDQLYINGERQRMARYPNAVEGKNVFDTWDLINTREPDKEKDPLDSKHIAMWKNPKGAYIHAMHTALWGDMHWKVTGKNKDGSLDMVGGWQNNRPSPMHPRYRIIENILEELDAPGEWYFDKTKKILFFYPKSGLDINSAKVEIVKLKHLIEFRGSKEKPVSNIHLKGLVFKHAARSFMENKEQLLRSDWTVYRGGALMYNGAIDCKVENCEFNQLGGNSIFVNNYNRRLTFKSCYIHHGGANGIAFVGDPNMVRSPIYRYGPQNFEKMDRNQGPKGNNFPEDCLVEDCLITMTGRDEKQTAPVQISMSHKITIRHCSIYDVPRAGINISEGTFGGHIIENCDVFNTVLETGDHGSFNSWGRDRFWTPNIMETSREVEENVNLPKLDMIDPNIIRNSRWRCDHGWDIDLDDGSSWYKIYNNVLLNGGLKMREGYYREATNNIIINNSLHPHVWYPNSGDIFKYNIVYGAYRPASMQRGLAHDDKWGEDIDYNLFATNNEDMQKYLVNGCDLNSIVGDPLFVDPEQGDFRVRSNSPALSLGFKNFEMDKFGVYSLHLKKIAKTPVMPEFISSAITISGKKYDWLEGKIKNIETLGEQSANGLSSMSGVLIIDIPENSKLKKLGFEKSDVVVQCNGQNVRSVEQLFEIVNKNKLLRLLVIRNQKSIEIDIHR